MSAIPEQQKLEDNINRNMTSFYQSAGKSNETPKSSFSTDTEVYCINFNTIHAPFYSFDDSISSDNDGYDTERHLRVIRQVSSDTYGSDNCFYSDSDMKIPDVIHQDNTTSNILYEMCDTLNKVPDILSGNVDNNNAQKEKSCRYSGTSNSSYCSDDRSPNWSPNSTPHLKQWPNSESERLGNDMTDTDSIIYHNIEDRQRLEDNVVRYSPDFLNSTVDLFNTKPSNFRGNPIVHDEMNVDQYKQVLHYPENVMPCERQPKTPTLQYDRNVSPDKLSKEYINLDILNKLNLNQIDQDIDHEISNLLNTDCLLKSDDKKIGQFKSNETKNSQFYEYDPSSSNSYCDFSNPVGETKGINKDPRLMFEEDSYRGTDWLRRIVKENKTSYTPEIGKKSNENKYPDLAYYQKENNKQYDLSESISAPDIFERNKKHRYSTSSIDEGSDYDPEMRFHKFSKSISNVNIHEYGKKYFHSNLAKNRNSREELRRIEKAVENMLEQVEIQENLLENDMNNMRKSQRKSKDIPFLIDRRNSVSKFSDNLTHVPINCNRNPLKYKYQTKPDLNVMSSSNVSSSCSIEDLERSVNKILSDVEQEESKLFSSRNLNEYNPRRDVAASSEDYKIENKLPHSKYIETLALDSTFNDSLKNQDLTFGRMGQSLSQQPQYYYNIPSSSSNSNPNVFSSNPHIKSNFKTDQDVWWEGAYHGLHEDLGELQRKVKRSNKRATFWPNNPYGFDRQISYTPSSEEGYSSSSNSESEIEPSSKKGAISLRVSHLRNGKHGIQIEPVHRTSRNQIEMSNHSLNSLWNRSMPSLPSASSESSVKSALSLQSSGSEDCLSNPGYYQNLVIPSCSIEYITPAELGFSSNLLNSGYCHWNFPDEEESIDQQNQKLDVEETTEEVDGRNEESLEQKKSKKKRKRGKNKNKQNNGNNNNSQEKESEVYTEIDEINVSVEEPSVIVSESINIVEHVDEKKGKNKKNKKESKGITKELLNATNIARSMILINDPSRLKDNSDVNIEPIENPPDDQSDIANKNQVDDLPISENRIKITPVITEVIPKKTESISLDLSNKALSNTDPERETHLLDDYIETVQQKIKITLQPNNTMNPSLETKLNDDSGNFSDSKIPATSFSSDINFLTSDKKFTEMPDKISGVVKVLSEINTSEPPAGMSGKVMSEKISSEIPDIIHGNSKVTVEKITTEIPNEILGISKITTEIPDEVSGISKIVTEKLTTELNQFNDDFPDILFSDAARAHTSKDSEFLPNLDRVSSKLLDNHNNFRSAAEEEELTNFEETKDISNDAKFNDIINNLSSSSREDIEQLLAGTLSQDPGTQDEKLTNLLIDMLIEQETMKLAASGDLPADVDSDGSDLEETMSTNQTSTNSDNTVIDMNTRNGNSPETDTTHKSYEKSGESGEKVKVLRTIVKDNSEPVFTKFTDLCEEVSSSDGNQSPKPYVTTPTLSRRGIGGSQRYSREERPDLIEISRRFVSSSSSDEEGTDDVGNMKYVVTEPSPPINKRKVTFKFDTEDVMSDDDNDDKANERVHFELVEETKNEKKKTAPPPKLSRSPSTDSTNKRNSIEIPNLDDMKVLEKVERKFERMASETLDDSSIAKGAVEGEFQRLMSQLSHEEMDECLLVWDESVLVPISESKAEDTESIDELDAKGGGGGRAE